jgi:hypothetical protein
MALGLLFWILMLLWVLGGFYTRWPATPTSPVWWAPDALLFILLVILGWHAFGAPLRP